VSVTDWDDAFLDGLRSVGDPEADAVISGLFSGTSDAASAFRALVVEQKEQLDPALAAYLSERDDPPSSWAKADRVAAGQECFATWGSHVFTALYAAALPSAYACWRGVQVLGLTARLETDTKRRLNETAQFHLDVMQPGGLEYGARGYSDVRHVRLMHAAVRWLIEHDPRVQWDPAWGTPINQEDLLETLLTFTEIVFEVFDRTGVVYTEHQANDYLRTWSVIGYHLGVRPDLLPLTRAQTAVLMPLVRRRQLATSQAGRELTEALLDQGRHLAPPGLRGLPATTLRFHVGDETADLLGVPPADWTRLLFRPLADLSRRLSMERLHRRALTRFSDRIGFGMLELAVRAERYGGRPAFQVPTSLASRWNIPATARPTAPSPDSAPQAAIP
jgi:ER-bound oxygenase mpaB/B'/Rubber oxygenase, catalytic domain